MLMQIFAIILDILLLTDKSKIINIVKHLVTTSNSVKGKYGPLCICIQKLGCKVVFDENPCFVQDLVVGLGINHFASAVSKVYKAVALTLFPKPKDSFDLLKWEQILGLPLVNALLNSSLLIHQNALSYWVLINLNLHSSILPRLLYLVSNNFPEKNIDELRISAQIGIYKIARNNKVMHFKEMEPYILNQAFSSHNNTIRANVFWLVCKNPKKCEQISELELLLLQQHIPMNMNMDCTSFRNDFISAVNYFLERIYYTLITEEKQVL